jgi:hypothetical protein
VAGRPRHFILKLSESDRSRIEVGSRRHIGQHQGIEFVYTDIDFICVCEMIKCSTDSEASNVNLLIRKFKP